MAVRTASIGFPELADDAQRQASFSENALAILRLRYLRRDPQRRLVESPDELVQRVAWAVAGAEALYGGRSQLERAARLFARIMGQLDFLPNSPVLMNAGTPLGQLFACFVLPVEDSLDGIFDALRASALIQQAGGGTGFSFSRLRPRGDVVSSTRGVSSGPVSFISVFDRATEVITTGGLRRGANMAVLRADHPDIVEFIRAKEDPLALPTFNTSVAVTDSFMGDAATGRPYALVNPRNGAVVGTVNARAVMDEIVRCAWNNGQPGLLFLDRINRDNPTPHLGALESTNPCSEQPLLPYEACCLGSINLSRMARVSGERVVVDYRRLRRTARAAVRFLDDAIDANRYLLRQTEELSQTNRKIGLGVMGFADLLIELGIPYASDEALHLAHRLMGFIRQAAIAESESLAEQRGPFPGFARSVLAESEARPRRNAALTTVAPTGTLSILAGCSAGIEPLYALAFARELAEGVTLSFRHPAVAALSARLGLPPDTILELLAEQSSRLPAEVHPILATAYGITPTWHVRMQAAFQEHVDAGVSKTVNLPETAPAEMVRTVLSEAHRFGCKGITVFRNESRPDQPLRVAGLCLACDAPASTSG